MKHSKNVACSVQANLIFLSLFLSLVFFFYFLFIVFYYTTIFCIALYEFFFSPARFFFFSFLKICKDCTARVAWQLHQAGCVNSLCVDDVVDLEMLGSSCDLRSVAFHSVLSSLAGVRNTASLTRTKTIVASRVQ